MSNDAVMIRLQKGTYSRYFLWRVGLEMLKNIIGSGALVR